METSRKVCTKIKLNTKQTRPRNWRHVMTISSFFLSFLTNFTIFVFHCLCLIIFVWFRGTVSFHRHLIHPHLRLFCCYRHRRCYLLQSTFAFRKFKCLASAFFLWMCTNVVNGNCVLSLCVRAQENMRRALLAFFLHGPKNAYIFLSQHNNSIDALICSFIDRRQIVNYVNYIILFISFS